MSQSVGARIRYLSPEWRGRDGRPQISSRESRRANTRFYDVRIADARPLQERGELDLDTNGFILVEHRPDLRDFHDAEEVKRAYYPGIRSLIEKLTGAAQVAVLHHVIRTEKATSFNEAYARYVHCDFSEARAEEMTRKLLAERGIRVDLSSGRYDVAWYNTWQPIEREVQQNPLMLVDSGSLETADLAEYTFGDAEYDAVASMPFYNAKHRHFYFPRMQTHELIVSKQLDSRPGRARLCPHTSFDDLTAPADALRRRSIEVRVMCLFGRDP